MFTPSMLTRLLLRTSSNQNHIIPVIRNLPGVQQQQRGIIIRTMASTSTDNDNNNNNNNNDTTQAEAQIFVNTFNKKYAEKHEAFENQFWGTKMALSSSTSTDNNTVTTYSTELLSKTKKEMEDLLSNPDLLNKAKTYRDTLLLLDDDGSNKKSSADLLKVLTIIIRTCQCNEFPTRETKLIREETNKLEGTLEKARNEMSTLGYYCKNNNEDGDENNNQKFISASSVGLRTIMRTSSDESVRKSAYEDGLRSIGSFVLENGFLDIIKLRNQLGKLLGYQDYYDYTVSNSEGFSKSKLFEILDGLEVGTRPLMIQARQELVKEHGPKALEPWNTGYMMAGSVIKEMDPYFPFSKSVENYLRSYSAMKIGYCGATMTLDLLDRPKKYSNGFCHWPIPAWMKPDGTFQPSKTNFTSLADPSAVGSGLTALNTLMHEAGHAAHFANIKQPSPLFSQERAPTSVAYAENQSMFLDSLVDDSSWRAKYAKNLEGESIPFDIIEENIRSTHPYKVFSLRAMLCVSYFEKALYELPDEELTSKRIQELADEIEIQIQGGLSARPLLSVPHLVSDEASCYYQGYTLAEMSVHQTREYFKTKYGYIVDNPNVGPTLTKSYWECGNSKPFLEIVKDLTGKELTGKAWIDALNEDLEEHVVQEKKEYDEMIEKCLIEEKQKKEKQQQQQQSNGDDDDGDELDLQMTVKFVDGDTIISDSNKAGLLGACKEFEAFVAARTASA